ncbi:DEAD/DEAH box helicase family protein [uncultured Phenylobacterium sp.]|uniref:DEAD/DEAH box helicase family protein n=1 Tax=uncultured Phenylobacterium sp. TaxID=349273 RepID=UPI0025F29002|nr:DEAD/DEAH box helicase family protein [uncultured Phenylobacterium sp.]
MAQSFFEQPILNSPYEPPHRHHGLDPKGQPLDSPPIDGRRKSELISPVPPSRKQGKKAKQAELDLDLFAEEDEEGQAYTLAIINEIRSYVTAWRGLNNPADWGVTPVTQRLLQYWRHHEFESVRPFFCQVEAAETAIWLTEVAPKQKQHAHLWKHIQAANQGANPELMRIALKLATGAGKTTVMAMLIAWQTLNAVRSPASNQFSRAFLIVAPGITIRDRLQILLPSHPDNYYAKRELVPADMLLDVAKAKIVLTNYHAFKRREVMELTKVGRAFLQGRDAPIQTTETEGAMLKRACGELLAFKNVVVINDEAHHCYRERPQGDAETPIAAEDREEAKRNSEAARLWISGLEALKRKVGVRTVFDLSATPFFLRGSGYREGTLFPWTVSDFSLMDAIECGIVKLPRIPWRTIPSPAKCRSIASCGSISASGCRRRARRNPASSIRWRRRSRLNCRPPSMRSTATTKRRSRSGSRPGWRRRRSSSWCATTPPRPSSSTNGSRASSARTKMARCASAMPATCRSSATTMSTATG